MITRLSSPTARVKLAPFSIKRNHSVCVRMKQSENKEIEKLSVSQMKTFFDCRTEVQVQILQKTKLQQHFRRHRKKGHFYAFSAKKRLKKGARIFRHFTIRKAIIGSPLFASDNNTH